MPTKLFDKEGNEVEAYTKDEIETQKTEALESYKKANPDTKDQFTKLQKELDDTKVLLEKAEKGGMSEGQKDRLKKAADEAEQRLKDFEKTTNDKIDSLKASIVEGPRRKLIERLSGGNAEMKEKIELKLKSLTGYEASEEGVTKQVVDAYTLVMGNAPKPEVLDGIGSAGGRGNGGGPEKNQPVTENSKKIQGAFGISDQEAEKYGGMINK